MQVGSDLHREDDIVISPSMSHTWLSYPDWDAKAISTTASGSSHSISNVQRKASLAPPDTKFWVSETIMPHRMNLIQLFEDLVA